MTDLWEVIATQEQGLCRAREKATRQKEHIAGQARSIVRLKEENAKLRHDMSEALSRMVSVKPAPVVRPECYAKLVCNDMSEREPSAAWKIGAIWFGMGVLAGYFMV
jgi:hypothetical protein